MLNTHFIRSIDHILMFANPPFQIVGIRAHKEENPHFNQGEFPRFWGPSWFNLQKAVPWILKSLQFASLEDEAAYSEAGPLSIKGDIEHELQDRRLLL